MENARYFPQIGHIDGHMRKLVRFIGGCFKYVKRTINSNSILTSRHNMKTLFWTLAFICISPLTHAADGAKGFLVFEIGRSTWSEGTKGGSNTNQKFKIPLTEEFISNFKRVTSQNSVGSGLWCNGGDRNSSEGSTRFMWWVRKTTDHRWSINMWGEGVEKYPKI